MAVFVLHLLSEDQTFFFLVNTISNILFNCTLSHSDWSLYNAAVTTWWIIWDIFIGFTICQHKFPSSVFHLCHVSVTFVLVCIAIFLFTSALFLDDLLHSRKKTLWAWGKTGLCIHFLFARSIVITWQNTWGQAQVSTPT